MPPVDENLTAEEQAQFDTMREADAQPEAEPAPESKQPAAVEEETKADGEPAIPAKEPRTQTVPLAALQEERERRKESDNRAKLLEERTNLILQRFATQQPQVPQQQQPQAPTIPTLEQDPVGHMVGTQQQLAANQNIIAQAIQAQLQQQAQQQQIQAIHARAVAQENEFRATAPDYDEAVKFVMDKRNEQLAIAGISDPGERFRVIQHEGLQLAAMAQQQGRNPAAVVYEMAKAFGHVKAAPAAAASAGDGVAASQQDDGARLRQVQAGQEQGRSLGAVRGTAPAAVSVQRLLAMTEGEFAAALDKASPDKLREMFGS